MDAGEAVRAASLPAADGCRQPPVRSSSRGGWWTVTVYLRYRAELGCTCRPSIWQLPSSRWKAIRAALERAVKRATAAAAARGRWRGRRQPTGCRSSTARRRRAPAGRSGAQAAASDPSELPPRGLLDKDDDGDEALSLEALRLLLAVRDAAD